MPTPLSQLKTIAHQMRSAVASWKRFKGTETYEEAVRRTLAQSGLSRSTMAKRSGVDEAVFHRFIDEQESLPLESLDRLAEAKVVGQQEAHLLKRCRKDVVAYRELSATGGRLLDCAMQLGAFGAPEYVHLRQQLDDIKREWPDDWPEKTFPKACTVLLPEAGVRWEKDGKPVTVYPNTIFNRMAKLIEREAARLTAPKSQLILTPLQQSILHALNGRALRNSN